MIEALRRVCSCALIAVVCLCGSSAAVAQETCGVTVVVHRNGFEPGSMPAYSPPSDTTPLTLAVTYPTEGATVGNDTLILAGTLSGPANIGVSVNGQLARTTNTGFVSAPVTLSPGSNAITVQLHTIDGLGPSVVRNVTFSAAAAPRVTVAPLVTAAVIPATVRFNVSKAAGEPLSLTRVQLDYDSNGSTDVDTPTPNNLAFLYRAPGVFAIAGTATLDDTDPQTPPVLVPLSTHVVVQHPQQTRFALCSVYGTMRTRLAAQDVPGALRALTEDIRPAFQTLWTDLGAQLPTVAPQLGTIIDGHFSSDSAELLLARPITGQPGQSRAYRMQLVIGEFGVWRISAM